MRDANKNEGPTEQALTNAGFDPDIAKELSNPGVDPNGDGVFKLGDPDGPVIRNGGRNGQVTLRPERPQPHAPVYAPLPRP